MTTTPNPTAEQIVADAITAYWADEERSGPNRGSLAHDFACGEAAVAALRARGLLSEGAPSEEQIERAARAILPGTAWWEPIDADCDPRWPDEQRRAQEQARREARAALTAAAGVAPQEPSEIAYTLMARELHQTNSGLPVSPADREELIAEAEIRLNTDRHVSGRQLYIADDESLIRRMSDALAASQPLDVDEEKLREVIRAALPYEVESSEPNERARFRYLTDHGAQEIRELVARAVVEYLKGER